MIFYSYVDKLERKIKSDNDKKIPDYFSDPGVEVGITYEYRTKDGIKNLVPSGKVNYQEIIDSYAESCDIDLIIQKFINGDTSVINPYSGVYGDFTNVPKTYAEMFDRVQICKNVFDSLPANVKEEFDNSYESFWSNFGNERFEKVFGNVNNDVEVSEPIKESEVEVDAE